MTVRAKFRVTSVTDFGFTKQVKLTAVSDDGIPENARFHKATPQGQIEMTIDNPMAAEQLTPGKEFYVDFAPAEQPPLHDEKAATGWYGDIQEGHPFP